MNHLVCGINKYSTEASIRCFFAIPVPMDLKTIIGGIHSELHSGWKPANLEQLHVTLAFMGALPLKDLEFVKRIGRETSAAFRPFTVSTGSLDCFPNRRDPKILFVKVVSTDLVSLAESLRSAVKSFADRKLFKAHLTVARKKTDIPDFKHREINFSWHVESFSLIRSDLGSNPPVHTILEKFSFAG